MFPKKDSDAYIKSTGERSTLGQMIGSGGGSDIPSHTIADAGKVLGVLEDGTLGWVAVSGGSTRFTKAISIVPGPQVATSAKGGNT